MGTRLRTGGTGSRSGRGGASRCPVGAVLQHTGGEEHLLTRAFLSIPGLDWGSPGRLRFILWEPGEGQLPVGSVQRRADG